MKIEHAASFYGLLQGVALGNITADKAAKEADRLLKEGVNERQQGFINKIVVYERAKEETLSRALELLEHATIGDEGVDWDFVFEARDALRKVLALRPSEYQAKP